MARRCICRRWREAPPNENPYFEWPLVSVWSAIKKRPGRWQWHVVTEVAVVAMIEENGKCDTGNIKKKERKKCLINRYWNCVLRGCGETRAREGAASFTLIACNHTPPIIIHYELLQRQQCNNVPYCYHGSHNISRVAPAHILYTHQHTGNRILPFLQWHAVMVIIMINNKKK